MIEIISGTNRKDSNTLKVCKILKAKYEGNGAKCQILDLCDVPLELFHSDSYGEKPKSFIPFQKRILDAKGLHVVTPEYNGSFAGALKYFIDHLPFPESFEHKCVAFTGVAAGIWGGIRAVEHLQGVFGYRNAFMVPQRTFISAVHKKISPDSSRITDDFVNSLIDDQVKKFITFVEKNS